MKSAVKEYTETILSIITDAMDNDLSLQWLKDKIKDEISLEYVEKEKQQIINATCLNDYVNEDDKQIGERYYKEAFKQD